jgi:predicted TIM-barrel fold metal-dependent hydrolase
MVVSRRQFVRGAVGAALATAAGGGCATFREAGEDDGGFGGEIIDTHQHLWDLSRFRLKWLDNAGPRLKRDFGTQDYLHATAGLNVEKAVYAEVAVASEQREAEAAFVADLCRSRATPTLAAVIGGSVASDDFPTYIARHKGSPYIKGVRDGYRRGAADDEKFVRGVRLLGEQGMSFDLLAPPGLLVESVRLVEQCPGTRFVLDHCGNPDVKWFAEGADEGARRSRTAWEEGVARLAERPNVVCKISGVAESGEDGKVTAATVAPVVSYCLDRFGDRRVMFASNWPVCLKTITLADWVAVVREVVAGRGGEFERRLFYVNAARFYGLG